MPELLMTYYDGVIYEVDNMNAFAVVCVFYCALSLTGCTANYKEYYDVSEAYDSLLDVKIERLESPIISNDILFIADTQKTLVFTTPILEQSSFAKRIARTSAHRGAAVEAFGDDIVKYVIDEISPKLVIHVGDAINNSCTSELDAVFELMDQSANEWYLAPGNHDGYYLGISSPEAWRGTSPSKNRELEVGALNPILNERVGWADACIPLNETLKEETGKDDEIKLEVDLGVGATNKNHLNFIKEKNQYLLDKFSFVQSYVNHLGLKGVCESNFAECKSEKQPEIDGSLGVFCLDNSMMPNQDYLEKICWTSEKDKLHVNHNDWNQKKGTDVRDAHKGRPLIENAWKSFVVQWVKIDIGGKYRHILIIDTASYENGRAIRSNGDIDVRNYGAADHAQITQAQRKIIDTWIEDGHQFDLIVGHHPIKDFDPSSLEYLADILAVSTMKTYLSGDTHDGHDVRYYRLNDGFSFREINMGSMIDAPIEYAVLGDTENDSLRIDRYAITPLGNRYQFDKGFRKSKYPPYKKHYATEDRLWKQCESMFTEDYKISNESSFTQTELDIDMGLYELLPGHYAYKINRLVRLANVYLELLKRSRSEISEASFIWKSKAESKYQKLQTTDKYGNNKNLIQLYYHTVKLVDSLEADVSGSNNDLTGWFKKCSFLMGAERDLL